MNNDDEYSETTLGQRNGLRGSLTLLNEQRQRLDVYRHSIHYQRLQ